MPHVLFENDVKMYGTQACGLIIISSLVFENDVKMYGTQAVRTPLHFSSSFENDVKMYGTQAPGIVKSISHLV